MVLLKKIKQIGFRFIETSKVNNTHVHLYHLIDLINNITYKLEIDEDINTHNTDFIRMHSAEIIFNLYDEDFLKNLIKNKSIKEYQIFVEEECEKIINNFKPKFTTEYMSYPIAFSKYLDDKFNPRKILSDKLNKYNLNTIFKFYFETKSKIENFHDETINSHDETINIILFKYNNQKNKKTETTNIKTKLKIHKLKIDFKYMDDDEFNTIIKLFNNDISSNILDL